MDKLTNAAANFLNQNFYGFCILIIAAFFYYISKDVAGATFFGAGAALMGVRQQQPQLPNTETLTSVKQINPEQVK